MKRVLLINDSKFEAMFLADMFRKLDYEPTITDEFSALETMDRVNPHLVVVNYIMEKISGDQMIAQIKAEEPDIQCLMSSSNPIRLEDFEDCGVDGIMRTPTSMFTLTDLLNRVVIADDAW